MNFKPLASVLAVSGLLIAGIANAGTFSQSPDPGSVVRGGSASNVDFLFAGDGETQDAQLDITLSSVADLTITPSILVPGSVCVLVDADTLRIVPPSGAGVALTSTATAYCRFAFTATAGATLGLRTWTTDFIECASPAGAAASCTFSGSGVNITDAPPDVTLSYDPTQGTTVNFTGGTGVAGSTSTASITATAGGTNGTATVTACGFSGGNAGAFALTSGDLSIAAGASDTIDMTCTRALTAQSSTLTCTENDSD
ncbi:MAG TPA: hypothetical protein VFG21_06255, partial [Xanthomonadaceae bacterium]|nr:hypothetical protein [Xanthomonadaceae bacterium]